MRTWTSFVIWTAIVVGLVALVPWHRKDVHGLSALATMYAIGVLPWFLTRRRLWIERGLFLDRNVETPYLPAIAAWYRNAIICAILYGGVVLSCSVDHNTMYESCVPVNKAGAELGWGPIWWWNDGPCRLTMGAYTDLSLGIGLGLAIMQAPLVVLWVAYHIFVGVSRIMTRFGKTPTTN